MKISFLTVLALAGSLRLVSGADISGKVILKGTPPPEITIDPIAADVNCGKLHTGPVTTRHYLVSKDGGLANVMVFIKSGLEGKNFPPPAGDVILDQTGCLYEPYVLGLMVNQKLKIRNSDGFMHNVHALAKTNAEFNFAQPTKGQVNEKIFNKPEFMIQFKCDVHGWMFAYVGVFEHPYFAVTDKDGNFKISGVPNGKYTLEAYHVKTHRGKSGVTQEITVSGDTKADFTIELK